MVTMSSNDGEQKFCEPSQYGILNRLYTCEAQVYVLSETTPGSPNWVELSDNVIPVHIVYNTEKNVYSILCVQHNKMIIDSPIDLNFVVMKGSPKFLQYHDSSTLRRYGVGFEVEKDAEKFDAKVNDVINEMKRKKFMFTPTSFVANGAMFNNAVEADVAVENNTLLAIQAQTSDMKQCLDDFSLVKNSPSCDLMSLERDRVKNAIIGNSSAGISPKSIDLERIMKKMENLERENKNLRDCIFSEQKEINSPKLSETDLATKMLLDRSSTLVAQNDVNALTNDFRQMCDALNIVSKEKLAAEKKLFTILRICKDTQASLTSAMHRINEIEGLVESQLK